MSREPGGGRSGRGAPLLLALSVGLVLADSSVVTLALPSILRDFDCTVSAVAWVLIAFNLALTLAAVPGWLAARRNPRRAFRLAAVAFAAASLACAAAPSLGVLVAARVGQGVVGAILVAAALELLTLRTERRRAIGLWAAAGVLGGAVGPALGGVLTEAFSWEAMFALQAPVVLLTLLGLRGVAAPAGVVAGVEEAVPMVALGEPVAGAGRRPAAALLTALALTSAALSAALFLLVVMLIEGWRLSPGEAALVVTAMPLAALVAGRWARAGHRLAPALPGGVLLAGGLAALGLLPGTAALWTIAPQLAIGTGLGLSLGALVGVMADADGEEAIGRPAAWTIAARHAGIVVGLLILTPIFTADLNAARDPAERAGLAHLLDAPIALKPKIALARSLSAEVSSDSSDQQLPDLEAGFAKVDVPAADRAAVDALHHDLDDELDRAATSAFSRAFLAAALLALLAAGAVAVAVVRSRSPGAAAVNRSRSSDAPAVARSPLRGAPAATRSRSSDAPQAVAGSPVSGAHAGAQAQSSGARANGNRLAPGPSLSVALPGACALATLLVAAYVALGGGDYGPTPVADPCAQRARPVADKTQLTALATIDGAACALGRGREELLLALLDGKRPAGVSDEQLSAALVKGVDRAEREGDLGAVAATGLRLAIRAGGVLGIIGLLLPD